MKSFPFLDQDGKNANNNYCFFPDFMAIFYHKLLLTGGALRDIL